MKKVSKKEMPFLDHLEELRWRILKALIAVFVMTVICFSVSDQLLQILLYPGQHIETPVQLQVLKVQTKFIIKQLVPIKLIKRFIANSLSFVF